MVDSSSFRQLLTVLVAGCFVMVNADAVRASDHLDTSTVAMNPRADIGDLFAWTSPDGKQLNLVMTVVARRSRTKSRTRSTSTAANAWARRRPRQPSCVASKPISRRTVVADGDAGTARLRRQTR